MIARRLALALAALLAGLLLAMPRPGRAAAIWYVSARGSNADGRSWLSAWRDFGYIDWTRIATGDVIEIDGGASACPPIGLEPAGCGLVYRNTLMIGSQAVTVRLASEPGRDGTAIIDGGLTSFTSCAEYPPEPPPPTSPSGSGVRSTGITYNQKSSVTIDGRKWGGIVIRNHRAFGVDLSTGSGNVLRFVKIHHITDPADTSNNSVGITQRYQSLDARVQYAEIFRIGQDGVRVAGDGFTLSDSYIHDLYCNHPDAVQAFVPTANTDVPNDAGQMDRLTFERNIFERIGLQSIFIGENGSHQSWGTNVIIRDNLFIRPVYAIKSRHADSSGWLIERNTVIGSSQFAIEYCCASPGAHAPMAIRENIFYQTVPNGTAFYLPTGSGQTAFSGNCLWQAGRRSGQFSETGTLSAEPSVNETDGIYQPGGCAGKGARLTGLADLIASAPELPTASPTATDTPTASETATPTASPSATPSATSSPTASPSATPRCFDIVEAGRVIGYVCFTDPQP